MEERDEGSGARDFQGSEERFALLVESVLDYAIFMLDPEGIVQTWNSGAERLKGYAPSEIIGRSYATFYPEEDRQARLPDRLLERARREGRAHHSGWRVRKDGTRFWADVVITALYEEGQLAGFAKVTRDMTEMHRAQEQREQALAEQRRALEQLEAVDEWRRDFVRSVVHDLQSPVTAIRGFASFLLDDPLPDEERRDLADRIRSNAGSLQDLIDHLKTWALLESGNVELERVVVPLEAFVNDLVEDLQPVLAERSLLVAVGDAAVLADRRGLERVLRNLLVNAARHTRPGEAIEIHARTGGDEVTVSVADAGEGLAEELVPRVFDRFEHGEGSGTGLGLAIVKEYVELHGGAVWVESTPGQGATFSFTLPAANGVGA